MPPNKWWIDEAVLPGGLRLGGTDGTFSEDQQEKYGVDAAGNVKNQATFQTAVEKVRGVRERVNTNKLKIFTVNDLHQAPMASRTACNHPPQRFWQWFDCNM